MKSLLLEWCVIDAIGKEQHYGGHDMVIGVIGLGYCEHKGKSISLRFFFGLLVHYFVSFQYVLNKRW